MVVLCNGCFWVVGGGLGAPTWVCLVLVLFWCVFTGVLFRFVAAGARCNSCLWFAGWIFCVGLSGGLWCYGWCFWRLLGLVVFCCLVGFGASLV